MFVLWGAGEFLLMNINACSLGGVGEFLLMNINVCSLGGGGSSYL